MSIFTRSFKNFSLDQKLLLMLSVLSASMVGAAVLTLMVLDRQRTRESMIRHMFVLADTVARNSTAALTFEDEEVGREILGSLAADDHIRHATLRDQNGDVFVSYTRAGEKGPFDARQEEPGTLRLAPETLELTHGVILDRKMIGSLYLNADLRELEERSSEFVRAGAAIILFLGLVAFVSATRLRRVISDPILDLAHTAREVADRGDYTLRAQKRTEDEVGFLTDAFNQMMERINEREESLRQRTRELERSNQELEQFAYVASHDLQEPLRMVSTYTQLLAQTYKGKLDADADEFIQFAVDSAKRMQSLIRDLLAYSRAGSERNPMVAVKADDALDAALTNLATLIEETGATIEREPLPLVRGDQGQLTLVFQNLIGNAIKFRGDTPPVIQVRSTRDGRHVTFTIEDNGIGIEPEYKNRIFQIFQRLHSKEKYPGSGIGLSICKRIVDRHNGEIWVESTPGQGAKFHFTLQVPA